MSGPGKQLDGYRCSKCVGRRTRCKKCRARRNEVKRARLDRKRTAGICLQCADDALPGLTLCKRHNEANNETSGAAHANARALKQRTDFSP